MTCGIYKIENKINGKSYIGQSANIERRWKSHRVSSKSKNDILYQDIRKYGIDFFDFSILEECSQNELNEKETYWIKFCNSYIPNGYNKTFGGVNNGHSQKLTYEQVIQIRKELKETKNTGLFLAEKYNVTKDVITGINVGRYWYEKDIEYPIRKKEPILYFCENCGKQLSCKVNSNLCLDCYRKIKREKIRPSRDKLKQLIRAEPFTKIGEMFKKTDNAIRKWCDFYNLPRTKKEINNMSDEEWELI